MRRNDSNQAAVAPVPRTGFVWPELSNPRLMFPAILLFLLVVSPELRNITLISLSDAFLQVSGFVAATLALVYWFEVAFGRDIGQMLHRSARLQPFFAALLGALPGCGGAIVVVTQYTRGYITFGGFVAVLVSTMGDAAFLLIAKEPATGLLVIGISIVVGTLSGLIVDAIHGDEFLRGNSAIVSDSGPHDARPPATRRHWQIAWLALIVPGFVLGVAVAFQFDPNTLFGHFGGYEPAIWLGAAGAFLCIVMWALSAGGGSIGIGGQARGGNSSLVQTIADTNFVTAWVVMAFLGYELCVHVFGFDLAAAFKTWAWIVPVLALGIGFIPGCGPQIVVTTLYLAGAIPLSAQLANAISNDGDALFPALALAPRAAVLATLYSAAPALVVGYTWFFLFE